MKTIDTSTIESLRDFAARHTNVWCPAPVTHMTAFVQLCDAALRGEAWAIDRVGYSVYVWKSFPAPEDRLKAILATDTRHPTAI